MRLYTLVAIFHLEGGPQKESASVRAKIGNCGLSYEINNRKYGDYALVALGIESVKITAANKLQNSNLGDKYVLRFFERAV